MAQQPAANAKATKDTEIVMKVSKGSEKKTVPNVVGRAGRGCPECYYRRRIDGRDGYL